jgi:DNA-binding CsgD family transcriptional regulator
VARFVGAGRGLLLRGNTAVCEAAARLGERLGVAPGVTRALNEVLARWDGKLFGLPPGEGVSLTSCITHLIRAAQIHAMGRGPGAVAKVLSDQVSSGGLDRIAVRATLEAAGQPAGRRQVGWPAGLADREVEVLRLLAAARSNRVIAGTLHVSEATVRTHALNIYGKTGVHSRAGIGLFAIEHDLVTVGKDQPNG